MLISNRGDETSGAALTDAICALLGADARAARPRARPGQAGRDRGRRPGGQRRSCRLHDVRQLLDRRRHPADLPDLRDARGRAPRRAGHRPCDRHAARAPDADVRLRRAGLRPRRRRSSARALGRGRRVCDGARDGERLRPTRASRSSTTSSCGASSSPTRSACCSRSSSSRISAWRVSGLNIVTAVREPARAARAGRRQAPARARGRRARRSACSWRRAASTPRRRRRSRSGVSLVVIGLVPLARARRRAARLAYSVAGARARRVLAAAVRQARTHRRPRAAAWTSRSGSSAG